MSEHKIDTLQVVGDNMNAIGNRIRYIPAINAPLSADVYCIEGNKYCYIYDVGNNDRSLQYVNQISKEKIVILSHHHKDHTGNIDGVHYRDLFVGKKTYEAIGKGVIVEDAFTIDDGVRIDVIHCTSPHTDGSLIVTVDNEYTLIADLYFTRPPFECEKAMKMIESLRDIDTKSFVISHQEDEKVIPKDKLITELSVYFGQ